MDYGQFCTSVAVIWELREYTQALTIKKLMGRLNISQQAVTKTHHVTSDHLLAVMWFSSMFLWKTAGLSVFTKEDLDS